MVIFFYNNNVNKIYFQIMFLVEHFLVFLIMKEYLTPNGKEKIEQDVEILKSRRKGISARISDAIEQGDLKENGEYDTAKNEQALVESEIIRLEELIRNAEVVDKQKDSLVVEIGSSIVIRNIANKDSMKTYVIVGAEESDPSNGKITIHSPIGEAVIGKKIKEKIIVKTPKQDVVFEIIKIE